MLQHCETEILEIAPLIIVYKMHLLGSFVLLAIFTKIRKYSSTFQFSQKEF